MRRVAHIIRSLLSATVFVMLAIAPCAQATTLDMPDGQARVLYQSWVDGSALPTPTGAVPVALRNCRPTLMACIENGGITFPDISYLGNVEYGEAGARDLEVSRHVFLHELAHVLDKQLVGRGGYRRAFRRILGRDNVVTMRGHWWSAGFIPDSETFADAYSYCASEPHVMPRDSSYGGYGTYKPTDHQHEMVCQMLSVRLAVG